MELNPKHPELPPSPPLDPEQLIFGLLIQLEAVAKAMLSLADSNRELVKANTELLMVLTTVETREAEPEEAPPTHYLDGSPINPGLAKPKQSGFLG